MAQAMINSSSVMPAWALRGFERNFPDWVVRFNVNPHSSGLRAPCIGASAESWLRGLDSNQNNQLQRLMSYQLDDPGVVEGATLTSCRSLCLWVKRVNYGKFWSKTRRKIRDSRKLVQHEIRTEMREVIYHFLATAPDPLLDDDPRGPSHHQGANPMMPESVHAATF